MELVLTNLTVEQAEAVLKALKKVGYKPPTFNVNYQSMSDGEPQPPKPRIDDEE